MHDGTIRSRVHLDGFEGLTLLFQKILGPHAEWAGTLGEYHGFVVLDLVFNKWLHLLSGEQLREVLIEILIVIKLEEDELIWLIPVIITVDFNSISLEVNWGFLFLFFEQVFQKLANHFLI